MNVSYEMQMLKHMLREGASDEAVSQKAIEIMKYLLNEAKISKWGNDIPRLRKTDEELVQFDKLIAEIRDRRHKHALDLFDAYLKDKDVSDQMLC